MFNIKDLPNADLIRNLYERYYVRDITPPGILSSHWKEYSQKINVKIDSTGELKYFLGYGFGDLGHSSFLNRIMQQLNNIAYFFELPSKKDIILMIKMAKTNLQHIGSNFSCEAFRQLYCLNLIRKLSNLKRDEQFNIMAIGDGFGFFSSVLKKTYPNSKITLIDIGKVLLFQAVNLQKIYPGSSHSLLSHDQKRPDFLYAPAEDLWRIKKTKYKLITNICSMNEMNYQSINNYFEFIRSNSTKDNLFYCCNRKLKQLNGGEVIEFLKYPWLMDDRHIVDEVCPFFKHYFSAQPPFVHRYAGIFMHRLTNLKTKEVQ